MNTGKIELFSCLDNCLVFGSCFGGFKLKNFMLQNRFFLVLLTVSALSFQAVHCLYDGDDKE